MCLLILAQAGQRITDTHLVNAWENNPDGGGFAFIDRELNEITIRKHDDMFAFMADYGRYFEAFGQDTPFLIHTRIATHGSIDLTNVHPFRLDEHTVLGHNGMIDCLMYKGDTRSDTVTFIEDYLRKLPPGWLDDQQLVDLIEDYISGSKMAALTLDPDLKYEWYLLNEKSGFWSKDYDQLVWFSNHSHERVKTKVGTGTGWSSKGDGWDPKPGGTSVPSSSSTSSAGSGGKGGVTAAEIAEATSSDELRDDVLILHDGEWKFRCELCYDACHIDAICFDCEYCTECGDELWKCEHADDQGVFRALTDYLDEYDRRLDTRATVSILSGYLEDIEDDDEYDDRALDPAFDPDDIDPWDPMTSPWGSVTPTSEDDDETCPGDMGVQCCGDYDACAAALSTYGMGGELDRIVDDTSRMLESVPDLDVTVTSVEPLDDRDVPDPDEYTHEQFIEDINDRAEAMRRALAGDTEDDDTEDVPPPVAPVYRISAGAYITPVTIENF